jgi:anaerobic magnesium-protoporphyrin IX monomethyl ester cyclase
MLDAIIISDTANDTFSSSSKLRLLVDGQPASIQAIRRIVTGEAPDGKPAADWHSAPKLNGIALLDYLRRSGISAELISSYEAERERFKALLARGPKVVAVSTTFIISKRALARLAADVRSLAPDALIVAGGPFVFSSYLLLGRAGEPGYDVESPAEDFLFLSGKDRPDVDLYVVARRGESVLAEAIRRAREGLPVAGLPNTARWDGGAYAFAQRSEEPPRDEDLRIGWRELPKEIFETGVANVQASIGCPFHCQFCNFVKERRFTFVKPLGMLVDELLEVQERGVRYVRFVDDNFRLGRGDLDEVCRRFIESGIRMKWMSFIRASTLEGADLDLLRRAGCIEVQMGIESADPTVLENMRKQADIGMYSRVIERLLSAGISCSCCFVVGFPGETADSVRRTIDFIESIPKEHHEGVFYWSIFPFYLGPLSPIYEPGNRKRYGLSGYMQDWRHDTMDSATAREAVLGAFRRIEKSGPIYSNDDLDELARLEPRDRIEFTRIRHALSKRAFGAEPSASDIAQAFAGVFGGRERDAAG